MAREEHFNCNKSSAIRTIRTSASQQAAVSKKIATSTFRRTMGGSSLCNLLLSHEATTKENLFRVQKKKATNTFRRLCRNHHICEGKLPIYLYFYPVYTLCTL
jgi:hypothetical protein